LSLADFFYFSKTKLMKFIIKLLLTAVIVIVLSQLLPGITTDSYGTAILVALALSLLNFIVRPILVILTLPITVVTLGLFLLVINVLIIYIADAMISGFDVTSFWWTLAFSLLLAVGRSIISKIVNRDDS